MARVGRRGDAINRAIRVVCAWGGIHREPKCMIVREALGEEGGVFSFLYRGRGGMADAGDLKSLDEWS